jgi:hypothetical protein
MYIIIIVGLILFIIIYLYIGINSYQEYMPYKLCLISQFKNEGMGLKTWIDHYIWQGVEHFYLLDDESTDNSYEILKPYIEDGIVTYKYIIGNHNQTGNYRDFVKSENITQKTEWLISCDLDEFFYGYPNKLIDTLDDYADYDIIYSNWLMFGSDGLKEQPEDIRKSILYRSPELHELTKYIFKPSKLNNIDQLQIHWIDNMDNKIIVNDKIRLNHYPIQSVEYFTKVKINRGDADTTNNVRDMNYFKRYDEGKTYKDMDLVNLLL